MTNQKETTALALDHRLSLEGRNKLAVTGVTDVLNFDEAAAVLDTSRGTLIIRGSGLHVEQLDLDSGQVRLSGEVNSLVYEETAATQGSFLQRLFR